MVQTVFNKGTYEVANQAGRATVHIPSDVTLTAFTAAWRRLILEKETKRDEAA